MKTKKRLLTPFFPDYGRLEKTNYGELDVSGQPSGNPTGGYVQYLRDGFGQKRQVNDERTAAYDHIGDTDTITYEHDALGRLTQVIDQHDYEIHYAYRADNQKSSILVNNPSDEPIYSVYYTYDDAGQMQFVSEDDESDYVAQFTYDTNGNRDTLSYYLNGTTVSGNNIVSVDYDYNRDNLLKSYDTTTDITSCTLDFDFTVDDPGISGTFDGLNGLGQLTNGEETITNVSQGNVTRDLSYTYDMLGELTDVILTNIAGANWTANYDYHKDGDLDDQTINSTPTDFSYNGDLLTSVGGSSLNWDKNGNIENSLMVTSTNWNWSNKLRFGNVGNDYIGCTYAPSGEMVFKESYDDGSQTTTRRKYIVDTTGDYPVVLLELNPDNSYAVVKTYIQANGQTLMQRDGSQAADDDRYFYLHDRLGSVRALIDTSGDVVNCYVYDPFGNALDVYHSSSNPTGETRETIENPFRLANYQWDATIGQYYCNARWYDPVLARFTGRDPALGKFEEPLTLHAYLYCLNDPISRIDPLGQWGIWIGDLHLGNDEPWLVFDKSCIEEIDKGMAATADGIIPFGNPFSYVYANADGSIDRAYLGSRFGGAIAREAAILAMTMGFSNAMIRSWGWKGITKLDRIIFNQTWVSQMLGNFAKTRAQAAVIGIMYAVARVGMIVDTMIDGKHAIFGKVK